MSETHFTPGPWRINKYYGISSTDHPIIGATTGWQHDWSPEEQERRKADMHLIATAPALYAALERLTYYINGINESGVHAPTADEMADANRQAQETLAQARGETE